MAVQSADQVRRELTVAGLDKAHVEALLPHNLHSGNRPSGAMFFQRPAVRDPAGAKTQKHELSGLLDDIARWR